MKKILAVLVLIAMGYTTGFAQASKNVHQLFIVKETIEKLNVNLPSSNVQIKRVKSSRVRVEVTVKLEIPNLNLLEYMIEKGRYDLVQDNNTLETELTIQTKKNNNVIIIKGKECKEELSYVVYVPESILTVNTTDVITGEQVVVSRE